MVRQPTRPTATVGIGYGLLVAAALAAGAHAQGSTSEQERRERKGAAPISADEPRADEWSLDRAEDYVLSTSLAWGKQRRCVTCHTNGLGLAALAGSADDRFTEVRAFARGYLQRYVIDGEQPRGSRGAVEGLVMTTAMLTISDMETDGELSPVTEAGLQWSLSALAPSGAYEDWLQCGWPPYEVDEHFGVAIMAVALGHAPADLRRTPEVKAGAARLLRWMKNNPPTNLHHKGMRLWAGSRLKGVLTSAQRRRFTRQLLAAQRDDGGLSMRDLGAEWRRADGTELPDQSDAYATAFALHTLRESGMAADRDELVKLAEWLQREQRTSGRWYARSPHHDGKHFISNAATALAVLALRADR